jgi:hypothetical protein
MNDLFRLSSTEPFQQISLESLSANKPGKTVLMIAHPGHELRVYGWLSKVKPLVCVLTNGAGHTGKSRLASTSHILESVGTTSGSIYGEYADTEIYQAVLAHDFSFFTDVVDDLVQLLIGQEIEYIVGDASEGYNPGHDICRLLIDAAVEIVRQRAGNSIANFDFLLTGHPAQIPHETTQNIIQLILDNTTLQRKLEASRSYAEMNAEVELTIKNFGEESFRTESFRSEQLSAFPTAGNQEAPFYEQHGERQVAAGYYQYVIRYRQHMLPLIEALQQFVKGKALWMDCAS